MFFLSFQLENILKLGCARAAELARMMIGRSDNLQELGSKFLKTGEILDSKQGNVQKTF